MNLKDELVVFLAGAPQSWRTPRGDLTPRERRARLAMFERAAIPEVVDLAGEDPGLLVDAYAHLSRAQFLTMLAGDFEAVSLAEL
ncbi:MAG TPA: hypothetical protein VJN91_06675 [Gammaproteobacteria bacterium]|nr:hypothetical protein [Gammaproteobacteria bacterium]